jgi:hypothetical protein
MNLVVHVEQRLNARKSIVATKVIANDDNFALAA